MTRSPKDRKDEKVELLKKIIADLEDTDPLRKTLFDQNDYPGYLATTWKSLDRSQFIKPHYEFGRKGYRFELTTDGWIEGLKLSGEFYSTELEDRLGKVCGAARDMVAGNREDDVYCELYELAGKAEVPEAWLGNAIEAKLIEVKFNRISPSIANTYSMLVQIPLDVGMTVE